MSFLLYEVVWLAIVTFFSRKFRHKRRLPSHSKERAGRPPPPYVIQFSWLTILQFSHAHVKAQPETRYERNTPPSRNVEMSRE